MPETSKDSQLKHLAQQLCEFQTKEMTEARKKGDEDGKSISPSRKPAQGNKNSELNSKKLNIDNKTLNKLFMGIIESSGIANN